MLTRERRTDAAATPETRIRGSPLPTGCRAKVVRPRPYIVNKPFTSVVCYLADRRGTGPVPQHRHSISRYLQVGPGDVVRLVALQEPVGPVCRVPVCRDAQPVAPVGQARYVEVLADRVRPVGVAPSPGETHRHLEGIRISVLATPVVLGLRRAIVGVVEETESHLLPLLYHRRLHDVAARVELEQLIVLQVLHVPVVVPVARVEEGGGGGTVAVVAD